MSSLRQVALLAAICLGTFMATLDISIVNVALPTMKQELAISMADSQWVVNAYALCLSALVLSSGPLGDRFGRKLLWLCGVVLFTLGSIACAMADSLWLLLLGRVIQGIAGAAVIPGALSLLTHAFSDVGARTRAIGIWSSVSALSLILGPIVGGLLVQHVGWQSIFWINVPIGFIALLLGAWGLDESADPEQAALDFAGQLLSILFLGGLTYGLIGLGEHDWLSYHTLVPLLLAAILFAVFIRVELKAPRPLLPLKLFRQRDFSCYNSASFVLGFSAYSSVFFMSLFFQEAQRWDAAEAGWRMAPEFIAMAVAAMGFGRLAANFGVRRLMSLGYGLMALALMLLSNLQGETAYFLTAGYLALLGLGMGLAVPATSELVMASVVAQRSGMASATMNAVRQTGMTLGIALLGTLMSRVIYTAKETESGGQFEPSGVAAINHQAVAAGFGVAMFWAGVLCLGMTLWLLLLRHPRLGSLAAAKTASDDC